MNFNSPKRCRICSLNLHVDAFINEIECARCYSGRIFSKGEVSSPPADFPKKFDLIKKKEKIELFRHFKLKVIEYHYRQKLKDLFGNMCFKCKVQPEILHMDHHIPLWMGGHLRLGNIVMLCRRCNSRKGQKPPASFYDQQELAELQDILDRESGLFDFKFNFEAARSNLRDYLVNVGITPELATLVTTDESHRFYCGIDDQLPSFSISAGSFGLVTPKNPHNGDSGEHS